VIPLVRALRARSTASSISSGFGLPDDISLESAVLAGAVEGLDAFADNRQYRDAGLGDIRFHIATSQGEAPGLPSGFTVTAQSGDDSLVTVFVRSSQAVDEARLARGLSRTLGGVGFVLDAVSLGDAVVDAFHESQSTGAPLGETVSSAIGEEAAILAGGAIGGTLGVAACSFVTGGVGIAVSTLCFAGGAFIGSTVAEVAWEPVLEPFVMPVVQPLVIQLEELMDINDTGCSVVGFACGLRALDAAFRFRS
jgi:hypothetical protein